MKNILNITEGYIANNMKDVLARDDVVARATRADDDKVVVILTPVVITIMSDFVDDDTGMPQTVEVWK